MFERHYSVRLTPGFGAPLRVMLFRLLVNALGLWLASVLVPGVHIGDWQSLAVGTAQFAIVNTLLKPLAAFVSCCLIVFTFGLFVVVINAAMLSVAAWGAGQLGMNFSIDGFAPAILAALVISAVSMVASLLLPGRP
jgi:putative membrane protein